MIKQRVDDVIVEIISSEEMGGYPMTGEHDAGIIRIMDKEENILDECWIVVSKNKTAKLARII